MLIIEYKTTSLILETTVCISFDFMPHASTSMCNFNTDSLSNQSTDTNNSKLMHQERLKMIINNLVLRAQHTADRQQVHVTTTAQCF